MKFCKMLAVVGLVAVAMIGARVAKADGLDPKVKIVVPTDPVIEPCQDFLETSIECFTSNSESNPVNIAGPTEAQVNGGGTFDFLTNFIYEPTNCVNGVCPASDTLLDLWIAITPTIQNAGYACNLSTPTGVTPAFNVCPELVALNGGILEMELECDPTAMSPCTGMLAGQEGSAEITPEPGELALLGMGIALVGFFGWKRRQATELIRTDQETLAAC